MSFLIEKMHGATDTRKNMEERDTWLLLNLDFDLSNEKKTIQNSDRQKS